MNASYKGVLLHVDMSSSTVPIVFIQVQNAPPSYMRVAIEQARRWNPDIPIFVLSDILSEATAGETWVPIPSIPKSDAHLRFLDKTRDNIFYNTFRAGFWRVTTERLFVLEEWMRLTGTIECIHMENDILLYESIATILPKLRETCRGISVTFNGHGSERAEYDSPEICFSIMYCSNIKVLESLCRFLATPSIKNEMRRGGEFWLQNEEVCSFLPTAPPGTVIRLEEYSHWSIMPSWSDGVFDGAAYGQFLGGNDLRNICTDDKYYALYDEVAGELSTDIVPYVNPSCDFRSDQFTYGWGSDAGRRFPYLLDKEGRKWKIRNLHIHSKRLGDFI